MFFNKLRAFAQMIGFLVIILLMFYGAISIFWYATHASAKSLVQQEATITEAVAADQTQAISTTVPSYINYQGVLRGPEDKLLSGSYTMTFRIYHQVSAPLTATVWTEEHDNIRVQDGQFSVLLGHNTPLSPTLFYTANTYIGVTVAPYDEMVPRQRFASVPYAMYADHASSLIRPDGAVDQTVFVDSNGNVGIGTTNPKGILDVYSSSPKVYIRETSNSSGADSILSLTCSAGCQEWQLIGNDVDSVPSEGFRIRDNEQHADRLVINTLGNVGIGTKAPKHQLSISAGPNSPLWTTDHWGGAIELENASAIGWRANANSQGFGMGHTNSGFHIFRTKSELGTTTTPANYDVVIDNDGNVGMNGALWVRGKLQLGSQQKPPVLIKRYPLLAHDADIPIDVSADEYNCVAASWSIYMDVDEDGAGPYTVWTYVENNGWKLRARFYTDSDEESKVDVLCFLRDMSFFDGDRSDPGYQ